MVSDILDLMQLVPKQWDNDISPEFPLNLASMASDEGFIVHEYIED